LEGAPEVAVRSWIDRIEIMNGDAIPAAGGDTGGDDSSRELETGEPRNDFSFPELGAAVVSSLMVTDLFGGIVFFENLVTFEGSGEGFLEGDVGDAEVVVEVEVGDLLVVGVGGEAFFGVGGEFMGKGDIDAEEVVDGVLVFLRGKAAGVNASDFHQFGPVGSDEGGFEGFEKGGEIFGSGSLFFLGGHFAGFGAFEDVFPKLAIGFLLGEEF